MKPKTASQVRTTVAVTMFHSGEKSNVNPCSAFAIVNHRIHPADSVASVLAHDERVLSGAFASENIWRTCIHSFVCCGSYLFALTLSILRGETVENRRDLAEMMREPLNE